MAQSFEFRATLVTLIFPNIRMSVQKVLLQIGRSVKSVGALRTNMWSFSGVYFFMEPQFILALKAFIACFAREWPLVCVSDFMHLQLLFAFANVLASLASISVALRLVHMIYMSVEEVSLIKGFVTNGTKVSLL